MNSFHPIALSKTALFLGLLSSFPASASLYIEAGTSIGKLSNGDTYFNQSGANGSAFIGSLSVYFPITSERNFFHFDLGLQNRLTTASSSAGTSLAMLTPNLSTRLEIYRFFVGGGFAPTTLSSSSGITALKPYSSTHSYFLEGGAIWWVIPEFQIVAAAGLEFESAPGGAKGPNNTEYGLRFRFPLNPKENPRGGVKFDGFRYPFGFMK